MPDATLSEALKEAYASAPRGIVVYHTLEIRHPSFTTPIRIVRDRADLTAYLEADAPEDPGAEVTFVGYAFDFLKPEISPTGVPQMTITIDNVSRLITAAIENATATTDVIECTYREYVSNDLAGPQNDPPIHMEIMTVSCTVFQISAVAGFPDLINRKFPTLEYTAEEFPGLVS